jgi:hypothetical protein
MVVLGLAAALAIVAVASFSRAIRPPRACYYCDEIQPPRRLRTVELSGSGVVDVCRDEERCRLRHQRALAR